MLTLEEARKKARITQKDMADELGISKPTYIKYEKEPRRYMTFEQLLRACKFIGVDTSEILFDPRS